MLEEDIATSPRCYVVTLLTMLTWGLLTLDLLPARSMAVALLSTDLLPLDDLL